MINFRPQSNTTWNIIACIVIAILANYILLPIIMMVLSNYIILPYFTDVRPGLLFYIAVMIVVSMLHPATSSTGK